MSNSNETITVKRMIYELASEWLNNDGWHDERPMLEALLRRAYTLGRKKQRKAKQQK